MKRGDIVTVALPGDAGKPRPAVIVETDLLAPTDHVIVCPGTSHVREDVGQRRVYVEPAEGNGLLVATQFQADKITVTRRSKCGTVIGRLDDETVERLNGVLALVIGLAD
ncbi:MAG: type II toxin-antitoxin system PemK/MazF family toxin [Sphingomonadaceae bacterium]